MRKHAETHTFNERLDAQRRRLESELARLPCGEQRDVLVARIEQLQVAADMYNFLSLPEAAR